MKVLANSLILLLLSGLLVGCGLLGWWLAESKREELTDDRLAEARVLSRSISMELAASLAGRPEDIGRPEYRRLRNHLRALTLGNPGCRSVYLLQYGPPGEFRLMVGSEPDDRSSRMSPGSPVPVPSEVGKEVMAHGAAVFYSRAGRNGSSVDSVLVPVHSSRRSAPALAFGMDLDNSAGDIRLIRTACPAIFLALALLTVMLGGWRFIRYRATQGTKLKPWLKMPEPWLIVAAGLVLSLFAGWVAHQLEMRDRTLAFRQIAVSRVEPVAVQLLDYGESRLGELARFLGISGKFTRAEFLAYTERLGQDTVVHAWEWIPAVPDHRKNAFEKERRADGEPDFRIWQRDSAGNPIPASGREHYFPVTYMAPLAGNEKALGFDCGSEPIRAAALQEARKTGLCTATDPILLIQETGGQRGFLLVQPVYRQSGAKELLGFALAVLRMGMVLENVEKDDATCLRIELLEKSRREELASTCRSKTAADPTLAIARPIDLFGKSCVLYVYPADFFFRHNPTWAGAMALLSGLLLTAALALVLGAMLHSRAEGEELRLIREKEANFKSIFEALDDMVMVASPQGKLLYLNQAVARKLGYPLSDALAMHVLDLHPAAVRKEAERIFSAMFRGERDRCPLPLQQKNGDLLPVETRIWSGQWNGETCIFAFCKDLSAEEELRQHFERIFRNNPALMAIFALPEDRFIDVNDSFLACLGYERSEVLGKTAAEIGLIPHPEKYLHIMQKIQAEKRIINAELQVRTKEGVILDGLLSGENITSQGKDYRLTVMIDISGMRQAERELRMSHLRLLTVMDNLDTVVYIADMQNYDLLYINRAGRELLGDYQEKKCWAYLQKGADGPCSFCTNDRLLSEDGHPAGIWRWEFQNRATGRWYDCHDSAIQWLDGSLVRLEVAIDITERKNAEEALLETNRQIQEANRRAVELARQADSANRAKSEFLANMSHELRTPLNAILSLSEGLLEQVRGPINERQAKALQTIEFSGRHLLELINDVLDIARVESGRLDLQPKWTGVRKICEASLALVQNAAALREQKMEMQLSDPDLHLFADPKRLRQMLVHLLGNAVKFTPKGGLIRLEIRSLPEQNQIALRVCDTGPGIADSDLERLFIPFSQLDAGLNRRHEGAGLGLALVRRLTELHGGRVEVQSELGKGSCFSILLPAGKPDAHEEESVFLLREDEEV